MCCLVLLLFFLQQKTSYEMLMSDWSSDVGSSDLGHRRCRAAFHGFHDQSCHWSRLCFSVARNRPEWLRHGHLYGWICSGRGSGCSGAGNVAPDRSFLLQSRGGQCWKHRQRNSARSEDHTSELQSLMRISYPVFSSHKQKKDISLILPVKKNILQIHT